VSTAGAADTRIAAWEDDPYGARLEDPPPANEPIEDAEPDPGAADLKVAVDGPRPTPGPHAVGTPEFRYWALADALVRGATYWSGQVPAGTTWQPDNGPTLIAVPDEGEDLNAYYDRNGLHFFHGSVRGTTLFSGESPDVVCHELGHAVLDAVKPQLFEVASTEAAAFHESFGDCSAILSNLQLRSMREAVLAETDGQVSVASRLSRLAEGLGWAIRQLIPDGTSPDCLRSAVNSFYYTNPALLPPRAPSTSLSSEPHSFSRVFTGGFFRVLGGVFALQDGGSEADLKTAAEDAGMLLIEGARRSPVVPGFMAQVAAHMVTADQQLFGGRYRSAILSGFVGAGVLSVSSAARLGEDRQLLTAAALAVDEGDDVPTARLPLPGTAFGLPGDLVVRAPSQPRRFGVAGGLPDRGDMPETAAEQAAGSFVEDLIRRGRIDTGDAEVGTLPMAQSRYTTHRLVRVDDAVELQRTRFDCGLGGH
jgi:hypothetical protein